MMSHSYRHLVLRMCGVAVGGVCPLPSGMMLHSYRHLVLHMCGVAVGVFVPSPQEWCCTCVVLDARDIAGDDVAHVCVLHVLIT